MSVNIEWREIPGWDGFYEVSSDGKVRSIRRLVSINSVTPERKRWMGGSEITPRKVKDGYLVVTLSGGGRRQKLPVHRAVLMTFSRLPVEGEVCRHMNGNPADNRSSNLQWGSHLENMQDRQEHGHYQTCDSHHMAKLSREQVAEIYTSRGTTSEIAAKYGVGTSTVNRIRTGVSWSDVTDGLPDVKKVEKGERKSDRLDADKAEQIREMRKAGWRHKDIAAVFGVTPATISDVCTGKTWKPSDSEVAELRANTIGGAA